MILAHDIPDVPAPTDPFVGYWGKQAFTGHFSDNPFLITLTSSQLPHAYLSSSPFFELTDLAAARIAIDEREKGLVSAPWISAKQKYAIGSEQERVVTSTRD